MVVPARDMRVRRERAEVGSSGGAPPVLIEHFDRLIREALDGGAQEARLPEASVLSATCTHGRSVRMAVSAVDGSGGVAVPDAVADVVHVCGRSRRRSRARGCFRCKGEGAPCIG